MSNFDPKSPAYVPPGSVLLDTGDGFSIREGNQTAQTLLAMTNIIASTAIAVTNTGCRGGIFVLDVSAMPASASTTIALKINIIDPAGGRTANLASRAAISTSGQYVLMVNPGISASVGGIASFLPKTFSAQLSMSSAATNKSCILSLSLMRVV